MTRAEILSAYTVRDGRIVSPGKFEGEMIYAPHFWDIGLNGFADDDDGETYYFAVTADDQIEFPELGEAVGVTLTESDSGFVYCAAA